MQKFLRLLAFIPAIAASGARAEAGDTRIGVLPDTPALVQQTDANLIDPSGISTTTSPLWVSHEGPGTATIDGDAGGAISGAPMTAGVAIPAGPRSAVDAPGFAAGTSDSRLDGTEASFASVHQGGPVSECHGGCGTSRPGAGNGLLGMLSADPTPISTAMGAIAVGSLAAAWGWKFRRRVVPRSP